MSTVKSKKLQVGTDASASNNFTIYQPATPDGTLRIGVGNADSPTEVGQFNANGYKPTDVYSCRVYQSTGTSLPNNTSTKILFDTVEYDYQGNFNTSTSLWTAPINGIYLLEEMVVVDVASSQCRLGSSLDKNTGNPRHWQISGVVGGANYVSLTKILPLIAGDTFGVYCYHDSGATRTSGTGYGGTSFSATLLHRL